MVSNYEKEPIFLLERTWDDNTKLPEKYKFQDNITRNKAEVHIDSVCVFLSSGYEGGYC